MFTSAVRFALRTVGGRTSSLASNNLRHATQSQSRFMATFLPIEEVTDRIVAVVKNFDKVDPNKVTPTSRFADDLGLDSLDTVEVVMAVEDEFAIEIPDAEADKIESIPDAASYIVAHPMAK